ncbi:hypothetical protein [Endozoicomonas sp. 4G]|uniref:hypothetical protein n=1 Tax=Endozoicomonas sp. 4G TaxID=2872754 RepID=UPI0020789FF5|nr:hypothetical protein [Endozoicomonas sp. 4G]
MKKLLKGVILTLAILGFGFTIANEMDLFGEQNDTDSEEYDLNEESLYQNEAAPYPYPPYPDQHFEPEDEAQIEDKEYDDAGYYDHPDQDESFPEHEHED